MKKILLLIFSCFLLFSCNEEKESQIDNAQKKTYSTQKYTEIKLKEVEDNFKSLQEDKEYKNLQVDKNRLDKIEEIYDEFENKAIYKHLNESVLDKIKFSFSAKFIENNPDMMVKPEDFDILDMTVVFSYPDKDYFLFNKITLLIDGEKMYFKTEPGQRNLDHTKDYSYTILNAPYNLNYEMYGLLGYLARAKAIKIRFENDRGQHKDFEISSKEHEKIKDMYEWYNYFTILKGITEVLINEKNKPL